MELRKAILKKAANAGVDIPVFVHKFGFDADNESVAIIETEKGDIVTVYASEIQFITAPISEKKKLPLTENAERKLRHLYKTQNVIENNSEFVDVTLDLLEEWSGVFPF